MDVPVEQKKVEIAENYTTLCPDCHQRIKGKDAIRFLRLYNTCESCEYKRLTSK